MSISLKTEIPSGVRDVLPEEAYLKRILENKIAQGFSRWGYREVVTPVLEFFDVLKVGQQEDQIAQMYKFVDRHGRILALRPDMTTPIARLMASRLRKEQLPQRLFYIANVFSYEEPQAGRQREYYQAGVELIGLQNPEADAEVLAVTIETLKNLGLQSFKLSIGQIDIFNGLMEELDFSDEVRIQLRTIISNQNFVGFEELLATQQISQADVRRVMEIITLRGDKSQLCRAKSLLNSEKALQAIENLEQVYAVLIDYGLEQYVDVDLGLLRGFDYYTGLVFEGFSPGLGFPICGGGRYDKLIGQFGYDCTATGFALGLERIMIALEKEGGKQSSLTIDYLILYSNARRAEAYKKAQELRELGQKVITKEINYGVEIDTPGDAQIIKYE